MDNRVTEVMDRNNKGGERVESAFWPRISDTAPKMSTLSSGLPASCRQYVAVDQCNESR